MDKVVWDELTTSTPDSIPKQSQTSLKTIKSSTVTTKVCSHCKLHKNISEFYKNKSRIDGLDCCCIVCNKIYMQQYRNTHKEKIDKIQDKYRSINRKIINDGSKIFRLTHKKEINKHLRIKRQTNINFKILCNLRTRLGHALKGYSKSKRTIDLLGCSIEQLKQHLEKQFKEGMNWENRSKWHIDHIKPCASFDLAKPEEQVKCFHYTNLQPLWIKENLIKKDKY